MELRTSFVTGLVLAGMAVTGLEYLRHEADKRFSAMSAGHGFIFDDEETNPEIQLTPAEILAQKEGEDSYRHCIRLYQHAFDITIKARKRYGCDEIERFPRSKNSWLVRAYKMNPVLNNYDRKFSLKFSDFISSGVPNILPEDVLKLAEDIHNDFRKLRYKSSEAVGR